MFRAKQQSIDATNWDPLPPAAGEAAKDRACITKHERAGRASFSVVAIIVTKGLDTYILRYSLDLWR